MGALPVRDLAYERALTLRVGRTGESYLDDPLRLEFD
jgi:hypothetical protein